MDMLNPCHFYGCNATFVMQCAPTKKGDRKDMFQPILAEPTNGGYKQKLVLRPVFETSGFSQIYLDMAGRRSVITAREAAGGVGAAGEGGNVRHKLRGPRIWKRGERSILNAQNITSQRL